jgi:hypothetical protein
LSLDEPYCNHKFLPNASGFFADIELQEHRMEQKAYYNHFNMQVIEKLNLEDFTYSVSD